MKQHITKKIKTLPIVINQGYSVTDVSVLLDLDERVIRSQINKGRLPARKIGRKHYVYGGNLNDFLKNIKTNQ